MIYAVADSASAHIGRARAGWPQRSTRTVSARARLDAVPYCEHSRSAGPLRAGHLQQVEVECAAQATLGLAQHRHKLRQRRLEVFGEHGRMHP